MLHVTKIFLETGMSWNESSPVAIDSWPPVLYVQGVISQKICITCKFIRGFWAELDTVKYTTSGKTGKN
jgi:hypothetical protein